MQTEAEARGASRALALLREWRGFLLFIVVMLVFRSAIADWNQVPSGSMVPSIYIGDRILVDKLAYDLRFPFTLHRLASWSAPERGDIVTFTSPEDGRLLVKRVVGVPGDVVSLSDNVLSINGEIARYTELDESELKDLPVTQPGRYRFLSERILGDERHIMLSRGQFASPLENFGPISVPPDRYLMLGDNRDNSRDSRVIGLVSRELILGRADRVAFSLDYDHYYRPRADRFFTALP
jgi:signal peptidase I